MAARIVSRKAVCHWVQAAACYFPVPSVLWIPCFTPFGWFLSVQGRKGPPIPASTFSAEKVNTCWNFVYPVLSFQKLVWLNATSWSIRLFCPVATVSPCTMINFLWFLFLTYYTRLRPRSIHYKISIIIFLNVFLNVLMAISWFVPRMKGGFSINAQPVRNPGKSWEHREKDAANRNAKLESDDPFRAPGQIHSGGCVSTRRTDVWVYCRRRFDAIDIMNQECFSPANKQAGNYFGYVFPPTIACRVTLQDKFNFVQFVWNYSN